jgi:outer membrane lipoprotein carrier protein
MRQRRAVLSRGTALASFSLAILAAWSVAAQTAAADAADLAGALQRKYDSVRGFTADFVHTYRGGVLNRQLTRRGRVLIKKPGKMRWEYSAPDRELFISDGVKMYSYIPADRQVIISDVPATDNAPTPALFLAGKGNLTRDFTASLAEPPDGSPPASRAIKLVPKTPQSDYDWLVIVLDPATLALRGFVYGDPQGGTSTFLFANLKENPGIADKEFDFKPPRGVDIVTGSSAR